MPDPAAWDPDWVIAPGETLRDWCEENRLPPRAAATACARMPVELFEAIMTGKQRITPKIAGALAHGTGISERLWLNLERHYRDGLARGKKDTTNA